MTELAARLLRMLHRIEDGLLALALALLVLLASGQILARLAFDAGEVWVEPSMRLLILWLAMLGALGATREGRHIAIDLLPRLLSPLGRQICWSVGQLFAASICLLMAWASAQLVQLERESAAVAFAALPTWVSLLILPAGFALMALRMTLTGFSAAPAEPRAD